MRRNQITNWIVLAVFGLIITLASSWYGAVLYVKHYPNLIEYLEPMALLTPTGENLTQASASRATPFVMRGRARRQPWHCWGTYIYFLDSPSATYSFPTLRSLNLSGHVHEMIIRNALTIPAGLPVGTYALKVMVYPTCDGVDVEPRTIDLDKTVEITD